MSRPPIHRWQSPSDVTHRHTDTLKVRPFVSRVAGTDQLHGASDGKLHFGSHLRTRRIQDMQILFAIIMQISHLFNKKKSQNIWKHWTEFECNWIKKTPSDEHTTNESDDYRRQIGDVRRLNETRHFGGRETKKHIKRNIKADELQHQIKPALTWPPARAALDTRANSFDLPNKKSIFARRNKTNKLVSAFVFRRSDNIPLNRCRHLKGILHNEDNWTNEWPWPISRYWLTDERVRAVINSADRSESILLAVRPVQIANSTAALIRQIFATYVCRWLSYILITW